MTNNYFNIDGVNAILLIFLLIVAIGLFLFIRAGNDSKITSYENGQTLAFGFTASFLTLSLLDIMAKSNLDLILFIGTILSAIAVFVSYYENPQKNDNDEYFIFSGIRGIILNFLPAIVVNVVINQNNDQIIKITVILVIASFFALTVNYIASKVSNLIFKK